MLKIPQHKIKKMAKPISMLAGAGNQLPHQLIISDLIYAIRKKHEKSKEFIVLSEISIDKLGNIYSAKKFTKKHNFDLVILDRTTNEILLIAEIERAGKNITDTKKKLLESLTHISTLKEVFIIKFNGTPIVEFARMNVQNKILVITAKSSHSSLLKLNLKTSLVSLK